MKPNYLVVKYIIVSFLLGTTLLSCKKNTSDGGKTTTSDFGKIGYFANASASTNIKVDGLANHDSPVNTVAMNWTSATVWVEKISFIGKNEQSLDTTIMVEKNLNIFNTEALVGVIKLPTGSYKDINVKMFCRKSPKSEFAFSFKGTFLNTKGVKDSLMVGSSYPFTADLKVNDIVINGSDNYKATFHFDLTKVLTGISNVALETTARYYIINGKKQYVIWKGGSKDEPFYDQVINNWQNVASIVITKDRPNPDW